MLNSMMPISPSDRHAGTQLNDFLADLGEDLQSVKDQINGEFAVSEDSQDRGYSEQSRRNQVTGEALCSPGGTLE